MLLLAVALFFSCSLFFQCAKKRSSKVACSKTTLLVEPRTPSPAQSTVSRATTPTTVAKSNGSDGQTETAVELRDSNASKYMTAKEKQEPRAGSTQRPSFLQDKNSKVERADPTQMTKSASAKREEKPAKESKVSAEHAKQSIVNKANKKLSKVCGSKEQTSKNIPTARGISRKMSCSAAKRSHVDKLKSGRKKESDVKSAKQRTSPKGTDSDEDSDTFKHVASISDIVAAEKKKEKK